MSARISNLRNGKLFVLIKKAVSLFIIICLTVSPVCYADPASEINNESPNTNNVNLDLSSTAANVATTHLFDSHPDVSQLVIDVGSQVTTITSASLVTPAQLIAAYQVLNGQQSIIMDANGAAIGGSFNLPAHVSQYLSNLIVPAGVTGAINFSNTPAFNIPGNITNSGNLYAFSTNAQNIDATISANNIANNQSALLSTVLPNSGLLGVNNAINSLNLNLISVADIVNAGAITSSGNLNLTAGGSIINALPAGAIGNAPIMQAMGAVNLIANSGNLVNAGIISSLNSLISVNALASVPILVNNTAGEFQAINSAINFRDDDFIEKIDLRIIGGDLLSQELNLYSGDGHVYVDANNITGTINVKAGTSIVNASTENLNIGNICLSGDPAFYNTAGNITIINSLVFSGQNLAIVASGNITTGAGGLSFNTSSANGSGGNITIIAGAAFTAQSSSGPAAPGSVLPPTPDPNDANITLTITGASGTGGNINLTGSGGVATIDTRATGTTGSGGDVVLAAFASGANNGSITLNTTSNIFTGGSAASNNGTVLVMAGEDAGTGIVLGNINTTGSPNTFFSTNPLTSGLPTGSIQILSRGPSASVGTPIIITAGNPVSGNIMAATNYQAADVSTSQLTINGAATEASPATITINSGGDIIINNNITTTGNGVIRLSAGLNAAGTLNNRAGDIIIQNATAVNTNFAPGGLIAIAGYDGASGGRFFATQPLGQTLIFNPGVTSSILGTPIITALNATIDEQTVLIGGLDGSFVASGPLNYSGNLDVQMVSGVSAAFFNGTIITIPSGSTINGKASGNSGIALLASETIHNSGIISAENNVAAILGIGPNLTIDGGGTFAGLGVDGLVIVVNIQPTPTITFTGNQTFISSNAVVTNGFGEPWDIGTINSGVTVNISAPQVNMTFQNFVNSGVLSINSANGANASLTSTGASSFNISGGGSIILQNPLSVLLLGISSGNSNQTVTFTGNQAFFGSTFVNSPGATGSIVINPGVEITSFHGNGQILIGNVTPVTLQSSSNSGVYVAQSSDGGIIINSITGTLNFDNTMTFRGNTQMYATGGGGSINFTGSTVNVVGTAQLFTPTVVALSNLNASGGASLSPTGTAPDSSASTALVLLASIINNNGIVTAYALPASASTTIPTSAAPFLFIPSSNLNFSAIGTRIATDYTPIETSNDTLYGYAAITQTMPAATIALFRTSLFDETSINQLTASGAIIGGDSRGNYLVLEKGKILFSPTQDIVVKTKEGNVLIAAHSVAYVIETGNDVAVYNLCSSRPQAVRVLVGKKVIDVGPGRQIVLTKKKNPIFEQVNPATSIAYRNVRLEEVENGVTAFGSDFSIPSAISQITPLKTMLVSSEKEDSKVLRRVLKSSVILSQLTGSNGIFKTAN
jgi:hypothetical protein